MYTDAELLYLWSSGANLSAEVYRRQWMLMIGRSLGEIAKDLRDNPPMDTGIEVSQWMAVRSRQNQEAGG